MKQNKHNYTDVHVCAWLQVCHAPGTLSEVLQDFVVPGMYSTKASISSLCTLTQL